MNDLIIRDLDQGLLTLAFNRPDKLNALNTAMYQQLGDLLLAASEDPNVEAIIITGGPQCFTAGNDLRDFLDNPPGDLNSPVFRLMRVVMGLDKPLIAAVSGAAIGIGATLLLHCDQVLVSRSTKLRMPFAPLGVCPEFGSSLLLPRLLGQARAARLLLGNEGLNGEQMVAWGLANELHEDGEQCLAAAHTLARQLQGQIPRYQTFQLVLDLLGVVEVVQAVTAGQQFVEGLRAAQEHQAHQHQLGRYQLQGLVYPLFPAIGTAAHLQAGHALPFEGTQGLADLALGKVHHRLAAGLLVTGQDQGIEGQRVAFRAGGLLFDQRAENADLDAVEAAFTCGFVF